MSNTIANTVTSAFLGELAKDKSLIKTINPKVIFRRVLGVGENVDRSDVIRQLQVHARACGQLDKFRNDLIDKGLVGEVISFDVGPSPAWVRFSVMREPLPKPKVGATINFIVTVTDRPNKKRYTRLIGAIANEADESGNISPVFRTISDMCEEEVIPEEVNPANMKNLKDLDEIIVPKGRLVNFVKLDDGHAKIVSYEDIDDVLWPKLYTEDTHALDGEKGTVFVYSANNDVRRALLEQCGISDILAEFDKVDTKILTIIAEGTKVLVKVKESGTDKYIDVVPPEEDRIYIGYKIEDADGFVKGEFTAKQNITGEFVDAHPLTKPTDASGWLMLGFNLDKAEAVVHVPEAAKKEEEPPKAEEPTNESDRPQEYGIDDIRNDMVDVDAPATTVGASVDESELKDMREDQPAASVADIDHHQETTDTSKVIFTKGEDVNFDDDPNGRFIAKYDITTKMWDETPNAERMTKFFDRYDKVAPTQQKEETKMDEQELFAKKGEIIEDRGVQCEVLEDITRQYINEHNGDFSALVKPISKAPQSAPPIPDAQNAAVSPIGDVPVVRDIRESITPTQHCQVLFGTTTPSIMHVMEFLKEECKNSDIFKLTGTFPPEQVSVLPVEIEHGKVETYTYTILRMKNGAYYRIWVSFTDKDALANPALAGEYAWSRTRDDKQRWMKVCDIQDREVSSINNRRRV